MKLWLRKHPVWLVLIVLSVVWWIRNVFWLLGSARSVCGNDNFCEWANTKHGEVIIATVFTIYTLIAAWILIFIVYGLYKLLKKNS